MMLNETSSEPSVHSRTCSLLYDTFVSSLRFDQETIGMLQAMNNEGHVLVSWNAGANAENFCVRQVWDQTQVWWSNRTKRAVEKIVDAVCTKLAQGRKREETRMIEIVNEMLRWHATKEVKKILDVYFSHGGVSDEEIVLILIHAVKKFNMNEYQKHLLPVYNQQNETVRATMERKLLPKLLTEDFNVADKIACDFVTAVASTNERALKQHLHFFFQNYRIGTEDQRQFAHTVLHSIKDKEMSKNINQILSTIHITSLIDARKDLTSIDTSSSDSHTSSHSSSHSNGSDFTIGGTPKNIKLKLSYMNEIHAMVITQETTWKSLLERIQHISHERDVGIEYKDEDDDFITMNSDHDFEEFKQYLRMNAISSIKVKVKLSTSFKDSTATQTHTPTAMHVGTPVFPHTPTNNVYTPTSAPTVFSSDSFLSEQASDGSTIQWRKGGLIGAGASGKVFLGLDLNSGSMIAVKKIRLPDFHDSMLEREIKQIETEILLMKSLKHCNVVNYLGYSRDGNKLYLFLEYMSGGSLSSLIAKFGGCLPEVVIQKYLTQILNGLSYLHLNGVVHRDIKGANLLMDHGDIKLSDFGLSKLINRDVGNSFSTKGTPAYMSPEIITRQEYSYGSDMWALGCTILEMFTGVPPWSELELKDPIQLMLRIATTNTAPAIPKSRMSENLYNLVMRCFEIKPQDRATAVELLDHPFLQEFVPVSPDRNLNMEKQSTVVSPESFTEYLSYESDTYGESSLTSSGSDF